MILSFQKAASDECLSKALKRLSENGLAAQIVESASRRLIVITSECDSMPGHFFSQLEGVEKVVKLPLAVP